MRSTYKLQRLIFRYAKAYYAVYKDQIEFKERSSIFAISELLEKSRFFLILINNTLKNYTDLKVSIMDNYFKIHNLGLPFEKLIRLLLLHNRLMLLPQILKQIAIFYDTEHNITEFQITTALLISDKFQMEICSFLSSITKKTVIPHYLIDTSLIGGFRAQSKEFLYENSLRKKLQTLTNLID